MGGLPGGSPNRLIGRPPNGRPISWPAGAAAPSAPSAPSATRWCCAWGRPGSSASPGRTRSRCIEPADPRNGRLLAWLHRGETTHRFVVYRADDRDTEWTRRCLRQADRVLASRLNPFTPRMTVPRIGDVVLRSMSLSTARLQRDRLGSRSVELLTPPVGRSGLLDFRAGPGLVESAHRYAVEASAQSRIPV